MITKTSLKHPNFLCKLHGAMIRTKTKSLKSGTIGYTTIHNRNGKPCLRVVHYRNMEGHRNGSQSGFYFYAQGSKETSKYPSHPVTDIVLEALREV